MMNNEIEKAIEKITNTIKTINELLVENDIQRQEQIKDLNRRIGTIEHTIARFEGRLKKLEDKNV
jgi:prefoldin subunit 5